MNEILSASQEKIKKTVYIKAWCWGGVSSFLIALFFYHIVSISPEIFRLGLSFVVFVIAFMIAVKIAVYFLSGDHQCEACNATYSVELINTEEVFLSAIPRSAIKSGGRMLSGDREGKEIIIHENWTEEKYDVTREYSCVVCGDNYLEQGIETRKTSFSSAKTYR
ncbi:hypothetical protein [Pantoea eucrina]|uniref:hypothetical protein n=1 Tax=Pantoea eucrina TaxID=472693 RepID=UPI00301DA6A3